MLYKSNIQILQVAISISDAYMQFDTSFTLDEVSVRP